MKPAQSVVITCDPGRLAGFLARFRAAAGPDEPLCVFDGVDLPADPVRGCWESHLAVLRQLAGPLLVFEDDAVFRPGFSMDLTPPAGWWLLRLGGIHPGLRRPPPPVSAGLAATGTGPPAGVWQPADLVTQTHAYLARDPAALAAGLTARATGNISTAMAIGWPGHYLHNPVTVTQL